ncbi:hypothetical protein [Pedobacter steynii]|uniref:Uncharacterized protein n=1 Tax=Pedobacter steynii TaxID=430522 RepID=A0A1D7QQA3_9SPHI|nr:hypothetical protein [Pedobacter steynii]AOM80854.1 hypothetical protein BFS30_17940 [Pedobacter steynii]
MNSLKDAILKVLGKTYQPLTLVEIRFKRYDLAFKTDGDGCPVLLFMGEKDENGRIKGARYARRLLKAADGKVIKDHWDHKGKATAQL